MSRVGIRTREEADKILVLPNIEVGGMYTHFAVSYELDGGSREFTLRQYERFSDLTKGYGLPLHCQNSGGVCFYPEMQSDYIRPGIMPCLTGCPPIPT